jgi:hypothetical protein
MKQHLKEYVAHYHKNDSLNDMWEHVKTYCLIKGYIDMELLEDWDSVHYTLTNTGDAWLHHAPTPLQAPDTKSTGVLEADNIAFISTGIYYRNGWEVEVRAPSISSGNTDEYYAFTTFIVTAPDGEPVAVRTSANDAIAYVDAQVNPATVPSAPDSGAGYRVVASGYGVIKEVLNPNGDNLYSTSNDELADEIASLLNTETNALRSQLASAQETIGRLEAENSSAHREVDTMQDRIDDLDHMLNEARQQRNNAYEEIKAIRTHIASFQYVINHAFKELRSVDTDSGAIIAARMMLEPYTTPENTED